MLGSVPDLLRLVAVPLLGWAAWRDVRTRRVPNVVWYPPAALGLVLAGWGLWTRLPFAGYDDRLFAIRVGISLGFVAPLALAFWWFGAFGGADAKAFLTVAALFPVFPRYDLAAVPGLAGPASDLLGTTYLPLVETTLGVFSMTVVTDTVLLGMLFPVALAARNLAAGEASRLMFLARRVDTPDLADTHGKLFETRAGTTRNGLDLDALRMYLRWRGATIADLRTNPDALRDPDSVDGTDSPGDGRLAGPDVRGDALTDGGGPADESVDADPETPASPGDTDDDTAPTEDAPPADPWAAERFLEEIPGSAYGTTPAKLRKGLEVVAEREAVWVSPGIPFLVPLFFGLVVALTYGDVLFGVFRALGVL
jgi:preflagellin peptidase FlaK